MCLCGRVAHGRFSSASARREGDSMRSCGSCTLCCKVLAIDEIKKPRNEWCPHCEKSKGCKIYLERPSECRSFECLWLRIEQVPEALKPQKCKVVLSAEFEGSRISAYVDDTF